MSSVVADQGIPVSISGGTLRAKVIFVVGAARRRPVNVRMIPSIHGRPVALEVRPIPVWDIGRFFYQRIQALVGSRVRSNIKLVHVQNRGQALNRLMCNGDAGIAKLAQHGGSYEPYQQAEYRDDHEEFQEGKAGFVRDSARAMTQQAIQANHAGSIAPLSGQQP